MWTYNSSNGSLSHDGILVGTGYSGHDEGDDAGVNNPLLESVPNVGPIPRGLWSIEQAAPHPKLGPLALPLTPQEGTNTSGRGGFFIHGDAIEFAGLEEASHGCIILARDVRQQIVDSEDADLTVV